MRAEGREWDPCACYRARNGVQKVAWMPSSAVYYRRSSVAGVVVAGFPPVLAVLTQARARAQRCFPSSMGVVLPGYVAAWCFACTEREQQQLQQQKQQWFFWTIGIRMGY